MAAEWYYADQGQQQGPVSFEELRDRAAAGQLRPTDLVWKPGFEEWMPASSQSGLFAGGRPPAAARPRQVVDDPREFERPRLTGGSGAGWRILLFSCAGALLLGLIGCGVLLAMIAAFSGPKNEHTWSLNTGESQTWSLAFKKGDIVAITVTSTGNSDVDLFVFGDKGKMDQFLKAKILENAIELCVAHDNSPDKDCHVEFTAPATRSYWVLLINRRTDQPGRNGPNSGKLAVHSGPK